MLRAAFPQKFPIVFSAICPRNCMFVSVSGVRLCFRCVASKHERIGIALCAFSR